MWQAAGVFKFRTIRLQDGILKAEDPVDVLWPFNHPGLPSEFAKVEDARSAIKFETRYSPLGYVSLVQNPEERKGGDPLDWVLNQAWYVNIALELIYALDYQDGNAALKQFSNLKIKWIDKLHSDAIFKYPSGAYYRQSITPISRDGKGALQCIPKIIEILVNNNASNIHSKIGVSANGELTSYLAFSALIEAIWSMLGDIAIKTQKGNEAGYIKKCAWCGTPFLAKDKRQLFCPAPEGYGTRQQSLCGLKYRQHKLLVKKNNQGGDGIQ